jgi:microcystin-dependent protein
MSYPYYTLGVSFEHLFEPYYTGGPQAYTTGYRVPDGSGGWADLNTKYLKWDGSTANQVPQTYYKAPKTVGGVPVDLNEIFSAKITIPVGTIMIYPSFNITLIPYGYLSCDGTKYKISDYPNLHNVIGVLYNNPSTGPDEFNVPNFNLYKMPYQSTTYNVGTSIGTDNVTLDTNNIPSHNHGYTQLSGGHTHNTTSEEYMNYTSSTYWNKDTIYNGTVQFSYYTNMDTTAPETSNTSYSGTIDYNSASGSNNYSILNKYKNVNYIIKW